MALLDIRWPFLGMMVLTFVVWAVLYKTRIAWMKAERVHPQKVSTPDKLQAIIPEHINNPANNYNHLFELPVLFYALALYLIATGMADAIDAVLGWIFLALRCVHSVVQSTTNVVMRRFILFFASSIVIWVLLGRTIVRSLL